MNLITDPWIPVVLSDNTARKASLSEVFSDGSGITDICVKPHERVSLMRLFSAIAHAALDGPKDYTEWEKLSEILPKRATDYFKVWKDYFNLFDDEKPWLQVAGIVSGAKEGVAQSKVTPTSKLFFHLATGNNTTLFDHGGGLGAGRELPVEQLALSLLSFQCFSLGGLCSQVKWGNVITSKFTKDAPCSPSSMVHAHLRGASLFETIIVNLPTYEEIRMHFPAKEIGKPVWEMFPKSLADSPEKVNATETYVGRLTPLSRAVKLNPNGKSLLFGEAFTYSSFQSGFPREPSATVIRRVVKGNETRVLQSFRPGKSFWRELGAIGVRRNHEGLGGPLTLSRLDTIDKCDLVVSALARDKATIVDTQESVYSFGKRYTEPEGIRAYESGCQDSELVSSRLSWAVETYRQGIDPSWEGRIKLAGPKKAALRGLLAGVASSLYWTKVENQLGVLFASVEALGTENFEGLKRQWKELLLKAAREAYEAACAGSGPRQMRAYMEGLKRIPSTLDGPVAESPPDLESETEDNDESEESSETEG